MNPFSPRRPRPASRGHAFAVALLVGLSLAACGGADDGRDQGATTRDATTPAPSRSSREQSTGAPDGTPIRISFGDTHLTARLLDTPTARDLAAQLPLTLGFRDHNNVEKTAPLPRKLSLDEAPAGHDPAAGDIGYWAPDGDFVLYYDDGAPYFDGIVRIGEFHGDPAAIARLPDRASATIAASGGSRTR